MEITPKKNDVGIILTDVDGTIYDPVDNLMSTKTIDAINQLQSMGISIVPVTARPVRFMFSLQKRYGLSFNIMVVDGGGTVLEGENIIWSRWLSRETTTSVIHHIGKYSTILCCDLSSYPYDNDEITALIDNGYSAPDSIPSIFCVFEASEVQIMKDLLSSIPDIQHTDIMPYENTNLMCVQISCRNVDKKTGANVAIEYTTYSGKIVAIGDGANDLPLFRLADVCIAMNNADEILKRHADYITDDVRGDGFIKGLKSINIL